MAKVQIGSRYAAICDRLRKGIRDDSLLLAIINRGENALSMRGVEQNVACYLCQQRIEDEVRMVALAHESGVERYFIDRRCYEDALAFQYREGMVVQ